MPLVKSFCHTNSEQIKISQGEWDSSISRGQWVIILLEFFFSPTGIFRVHNQGKSQNYIKYFQVLALEVFILDTNRPLDMDEPALREKLTLPFIPPEYSDVTVYYFEASQYLIVSILMGGCKVPFS